MKLLLLMITLIDVFHTTIVANEVSQGRKIQYRNYNRKEKLKRVKNRVNYYANCVILAVALNKIQTFVHVSKPTQKHASYAINQKVQTESL